MHLKTTSKDQEGTEEMGTSPKLYPVTIPEYQGAHAAKRAAKRHQRVLIHSFSCVWRLFRPLSLEDAYRWWTRRYCKSHHPWFLISSVFWIWSDSHGPRRATWFRRRRLKPIVVSCGGLKTDEYSESVHTVLTLTRQWSKSKVEVIVFMDISAEAKHIRVIIEIRK